ncbi:MAG TPA: DNA recombination protein RmuC [Pseudothermotoga sp.]|nr:DNA recombination protein RmuC [Pseudothermotoga sp.]HCO98349.1 DNA recombination protein RmuC [Pseudothermotoga sp.]
MEMLTFLLLGVLIGVFVGYYLGFAKSRSERTGLEESINNLKGQINYLVSQQGALSSSLGTLNGLSSLVSELKARYEEVKEAEKKLTAERDRRLGEFMENMKKMFEEISNKTIKLDEEKEKRIAELVDQMKRFSDEQRAAIERFLLQQGQSREEIEKKRDAELKDMRRIVEEFVKTVSGTKTRGHVGEMLLSEALSESIKVGTVVKNLSIGSMVVEFAWNLNDGKYIPIDSKLPDLSDLVGEFENTQDQEIREQRKREIVQKIRREMDNVRKYQNQPNTIDSCIMVVPSAVIEIAPELIAEGKKQNVFLCTYRDIFAVAHYLEARHVMMNQNEVGSYKQLIQSLLSLLEQVNQKANSLDRALKQITNANNEIKSLVSQAFSLMNARTKVDQGANQDA